jgi:hypothetical protein
MSEAPGMSGVDLAERGNRMTSRVSFLEIPNGHLMIVHVRRPDVADQVAAMRRLGALRSLLDDMPAILRFKEGPGVVVIGEPSLGRYAHDPRIELLPVFELTFSTALSAVA